MIKVVYTILFLILLSSCDILSPREPEEPDIDSGVRFQQPNSPSIVIENLRNSFNDKNPVNFINCFQDDNLNNQFNFYPSQNVNAENPGLFNSWDLEKEENVVRSLFNSLTPNVSPVIIFENIRSTRNNQIEEYRADYYLEVQHILDDNIDQEYAGSLLFNIVGNENDYWYIKDWYDLNSTSSTITSTWSKLKLNFDQ